MKLYEKPRKEFYKIKKTQQLVSLCFLTSQRNK